MPPDPRTSPDGSPRVLAGPLSATGFKGDSPVLNLYPLYPASSIQYPVSSALGLYVHIPFCRRRCDYCAFATHAVSDASVWERYVDVLIREIEMWRGRFKAATVFFGGGTPTLLPVSLIGRVTAAIRSSFDVDPAAEWTIEGHPATLMGERGRECLGRLTQLGFNRLSLGVESVHNATLAKLSRDYDFDDVCDVVGAAREQGFSNINLDLILGWPWESDKQHRESISKACELAPTHLSVYPLKIEEGTPFFRQNVPVNPDFQADEYMATHEILQGLGWEHYEVANFARTGFRSRHNLIYWHFGDYLGLGVSAASKIGQRSFSNARDIRNYTACLREGRSPCADEEVLDAREIDRRKVIMGLRLKEGVRSNSARSLFQEDILSDFKNLDYLREETGSLRFTPSGWLVSNQLYLHAV
ncbi:MAG: radical SAM family heme chaperone HemW [Elusimicrobia bacterium]|nr:radical SAM family heme chaperone HemW [Elusimicrobiota bacterium]